MTVLRRRLTPILLALGLVASGVWVARLTVRSTYFTFRASSFDHLRVTGLALAVGGVAIALACIVVARGMVASATAVLLVGLVVVLGSGRQTALSPSVTIVVTAAWLAAAAAGAILIERTARSAPRPAPARWLLGCCVVAATALITAVSDNGRGLGATLGMPPSATVSAAAKWCLAVHTAAWVCVGVGAMLSLRRSAAARGVARRQLGRTAAAVAGVWWLALAVQRGIHLLPVSSYRDVFRGTYAPWALIVGEYLPVAATGALLVSLGWNLVISPHTQQLPSSITLASGRDPLVELRENLATWTGDPTLQLRFVGDDGKWLDPGGDPHAAARYPRAATEIRREGNTVGWIDHDISLTRAPDVLRTAAELSGIAFDTNRFVAISEDRFRHSQRLSERLLTADIDSRREVAQVLIDGPVTQLRVAADSVRFGAPLDAVADQLRSATAAVRVLSHGVYPPELEDGGLAAVLSSRNGVPRRRLSAATEITAFLAAHDDSGAWFVDHGTTLAVHRTRALPVGSIRDRVEVLGGRVEVREQGEGSAGDVVIILPADPEPHRG